MKVAIFQFDPIFGEIEKNLTAIENACEDEQMDLLVLPELCTTGYQFVDRKELEALSEPTDGPSFHRLAKLAEAIGGHLVLGFAENSGSRLFNSSALVGPNGVLSVYRKIHLFADETRLFDPGDLGFQVFPIPVSGHSSPIPIGMMICFDWLFPESARSLALAGAFVLAHPANLVLPYCQKSMPTRALENHLFTVTANRVGQEHRIPDTALGFTGKSLIVNPRGEVLSQASPDQTEIIWANIDPEQANNKQITPQNHLLLDRRPEHYRRN